MDKLTKQEQINILEDIDWEWVELAGVGICHGIQRAIRLKYFELISVTNISQYFPLLTRLNALQFGANLNRMFWWTRDEHGYDQRKHFVNVIIEELKKEIQDEAINT